MQSFSPVVKFSLCVPIRTSMSTLHAGANSTLNWIKKKTEHSSCMHTDGTGLLLQSILFPCHAIALHAVVCAGLQRLHQMLLVMAVEFCG